MDKKIALKQVVIWGYKLHTHTHSYIHNGFYRAFMAIGMPVHWLDETDDISAIDFTGTLFITEHLVNKKIPCIQDCLYLTHYVDEGDFPGIPKSNIIVLKMSQRDFTEEDKDWGKGILYNDLHDRGGQGLDITTTATTIATTAEIRDRGGYGEHWEYHALIDGYNCWYTYWATDLFPQQINENIAALKSGQLAQKKRFEVNFVGHMEEIWVHFMYICQSRGIPFNHHGASFSKDSPRNRTTEENVELIQRSLLAPAFQSQKQVRHRYIPCRIFKNISYGKMGMTNNPAVVELFRKYLQPDEQGLLFSRDDHELMNLGLDYEYNSTASSDQNRARLQRLMEIVRDHHTFFNRIRTLVHFVDEFASQFEIACPQLPPSFGHFP